WKVVLNTTEFLLCDDLRLYVRRAEQEHNDVAGVWPFDLTMVDRLTERDSEVTDEPLYLQRHFGYHSAGSRSRLLHRLPDGRYDTGRHTSPLVGKRLEDHLFILW